MIAARCPECGFSYEESAGNPREGFPAGTPWDAIPDDWACPDCAVRDKIDFLVHTTDEATQIPLETLG